MHKYVREVQVKQTAYLLCGFPVLFAYAWVPRRSWDGGRGADRNMGDRV